MIEQFLVKKYIEKNESALELRTIYGTISWTINKKIKNQLYQVSLKPDASGN